MLKGLSRHASRPSVRKIQARLITKHKADAFADAFSDASKKPAQRAQSAESESSAHQSEKEVGSSRTDNSTDEQSARWAHAVQTGKDLPSKMSECAQSDNSDVVAQDLRSIPTALTNENHALHLLGSRVSTVSNKPLSTERVVQLNELSSLLHRLEHATSSTPDSRAHGLFNYANSMSSQLQPLTAVSQGTGRWTLDIPGNLLGLKSMQLQLTAQGVWNITLDVRARATTRLSSKNVNDLHDDLVHRGHRINEMRVSELSGDADNANE